jgi:hypothetical protein
VKMRHPLPRRYHRPPWAHQLFPAPRLDLLGTVPGEPAPSTARKATTAGS